MMTEELKKQIRPIDLAIAAARKRQSPRTKFVHGGEASPDTISLYENFCFVQSLFRQKSSEAVQEGRELLKRLLPFQSPEGNFPSFLHEFPKCWDFHLSLKIAPIFIYLLRDFGFLLGEEEKNCLKRLLQHASVVRQEKGYSPLWENRFLACHNQPLLSVETQNLNAADWVEWLITAQLAGITDFAVPYDSSLQTFLGPTREDVQEKGEPKPNPIEWILAEGHYSKRLLQDHSDQLLVSVLYPFLNRKREEEPYALTRDGNFRLLWKGETVHSLVAFNLSELGTGAEPLLFDLKKEAEMGRSDLFEVCLFTDYSPETTLYIDGQRGTCFSLDQVVSICTKEMQIDLKFEIARGEGDFCGQISRANRPTQIACKGTLQYEAFDWQIGLRTLRRSADCQIRAILQIRCLQPFP